MTEDDFNQAVERCQQQLDSFVEHGTEEELFISSYLAGHFDLIVGQAFIAQDYAFAALDTKLRNSLSEGFENDNLTVDEQEKTQQLWCQLSLQFKI